MPYKHGHALPAIRQDRAELPVLTCGGMRYQHKWTTCRPRKSPPTTRRNLEASIRRALELGINHIETARGYGTSEMQLGRILPQLPRDEIIVQTKVAPDADPREFLRDLRHIAGLPRGSITSICSPLHGINNEELSRQVAARRRLPRRGRGSSSAKAACRFVGFSTHAAADLILRAIETGAFDYVNLHWYFVNDFNWPAIEAATARDMGVFIISPNDKGGKLYEPPPKLAELVRAAQPDAVQRPLLPRPPAGPHPEHAAPRGPSRLRRAPRRARRTTTAAAEVAAPDRSAPARRDGTRARRRLVRAAGGDGLPE